MKYNEDEKKEKKDVFDESEEDYDENDAEEEDEGLGLFHGRKEPRLNDVLELYGAGRLFNDSVNLAQNVQKNENFYLGKQWEGAKVVGLPTSTLNFIKSDVGYVISILTSEKIKATANLLNKAVKRREMDELVKIVNDTFEEINERNSLSHKVRELARNAAIDGDGCIYVYWDADVETGEQAKGGIKYEIVDNTRVFFGNPASSDVQTQEYIIMLTRQPARQVKIRAKDNGIDTWRLIKPDWEEDNHVDDAKLGHDTNVTVLTLMYRDDDSGDIYSYVITKDSEVEKPKSLGIQMYPIVWLPWDKVKDCYHGQAMVTGLIVNQMAINKGSSMELVTIERSGYPRTVFDGTRIDKITNQVGASIKLKGGGNVNDAIKVIDGASINPQNHEFFNWMWEKSNESMGVNAAALGNVRPDNTSAIIANQRAGQTPHENTKERLEHAIKELHQINLEFMKGFYGRRLVYVDAPAMAQQAVEFARQNPKFADLPDMDVMAQEFDFDNLSQFVFDIKIDVGSSSYFSEIQQSTTLQNAAQVGLITPELFWKCLPNGYVNNQQEIVDYYAEKEKQAQQMMEMQMQASSGVQQFTGGPPQMPEKPPSFIDQGQRKEVKGGGGYGNLQREVTGGGKVV